MNSTMIKLRQYSLHASLLLLLSVASYGQIRERSLGDNCEEMAAKVDALVIRFSNNWVEGDVLIFVGHLGSKERSRALSQRRLTTIATSLERRGLAADRAVLLVNGDRVPGLGRIDAYVKGQFSEQFFFTKNRSGQVGNCGN